MSPATPPTTPPTTAGIAGDELWFATAPAAADDEAEEPAVVLAGLPERPAVAPAPNPAALLEELDIVSE